MFTAPRLTIGIPTLDRPLLLPRAIASALATGARVLIADQAGRSEKVFRQFASRPQVRYLRTDATCLWENWLAAAAACDTEFFAWLQDDDVVAPHMADRVVTCFDMTPSARLYLARLAVVGDDMLSCWWGGGCGPLVPMNTILGIPSVVNGRLIAAGGYFSSFALSPGVAFRCDPDAVAALRRCPKDCDLYNERIVLAELCRGADAVCDPATVGAWIQHDGNESKRLNREGGAVSQFPALARHLDSLNADGPDEWRAALAGWFTLLKAHTPGVLDHWIKDAEPHAGASPGFDQAMELLRSVAGRPAEATRPQPVRDATDKRRKAAHKAVTR